MAEVKKGGIKPKAKGKKRKAKIDKFDNLNKSTQKKYRNSNLASLIARISTTGSTVLTIMSAPGTPALLVPGPSVFMICAPILTTAPPARLLPIPIYTTFPHITL